MDAPRLFSCQRFSVVRFLEQPNGRIPRGSRRMQSGAFCFRSHPPIAITGILSLAAERRSNSTPGPANRRSASKAYRKPGRRKRNLRQPVPLRAPPPGCDRKTPTKKFSRRCPSGTIQPLPKREPIASRDARLLPLPRGHIKPIIHDNARAAILRPRQPLPGSFRQFAGRRFLFCESGQSRPSQPPRCEWLRGRRGLRRAAICGR